MNKYVIVLMSLVFFACGHKEEKIFIKGINGGKLPKVILRKVVDGEYANIAEVDCEREAPFEFEVAVGSGFFQLKLDETYEFYLNEGESIDFSKEPMASSEVLKRNNIIKKLNESVLAQTLLIIKESASILEFAEKWNLIEKELREELKSVKDEKFCQLMDLKIQSAIEMSKIRTLSMKGNFDYSSIDKKYFNINNDFSNLEVLNINDLAMWMRLYFAWNGRVNPDYYEEGNSIEKNALLIKNDEIRSLYVYNQLKTLKKLTQDTRTNLPVLKTMLVEKHASVIDDVYAKFKGLAPGDPAVDFEFKSGNGKVYCLADFKGKFLLIDAWATWCGPCRAETPHFKKLAEEFKDENIEFMALSLDSDKDAWLNYIKKNKSQILSLIAPRDFKGKFPKFFKITSIPRFILIDPEGKIVDAYAPRPSDPKLKLLIESVLKR